MFFRHAAAIHVLMDWCMKDKVSVLKLLDKKVGGGGGGLQVEPHPLNFHHLLLLLLYPNFVGYAFDDVLVACKSIPTGSIRGVGTGGGGGGGGGGRGGLGPPNLIGGGVDVYFGPPNVTPLV